MYITTICTTIFTKYAEITICRQKIVAILFYFFYNRSIRSIKRLNHKNSLYEFYILAFFLPESFCAYLALFFPCCQMQQGRHFHYLIYTLFSWKGPVAIRGLVHCLIRYVNVYRAKSWKPQLYPSLRARWSCEQSKESHGFSRGRMSSFILAPVPVFLDMPCM